MLGFRYSRRKRFQNMPKLQAYGSSMTGPIGFFSDVMPEFDMPVSFTVDDGQVPAAFFKVLHRVEPPEVLDIDNQIIAKHQLFDLILTWNERILHQCPNAVFLPESPCDWLEKTRHGLTLEEYKKKMPVPNEKSFSVSFLTSNKTQTPGHQLRVDLYNKLPDSGRTVGDIPVVKIMSPPRVDKREFLMPHQFHIAVENSWHNNWFADKIIDPFIARSIPIYWGCPNLDKYFNMDGVIRFSSYSELEGALKSLTPDYYDRRRSIVEDNYNRALSYVHIWDRIADEVRKGIARKQGL